MHAHAADRWLLISERGEKALCQSRVRLAVVLKSEVTTSLVPNPAGDLFVRGGSVNLTV